MNLERIWTVMLPAHMDLLRWSQSAWLEFASVVCEAFLNTPLQSHLLNFKFWSRSWSLAQELWAGRRKHCHHQSTSQETLLVKACFPGHHGRRLCCPLEASLACLQLGLLTVLNTFQYQGVTLPAGSGLHSPCWEAPRCSSTMVLLLVIFPFS